MYAQYQPSPYAQAGVQYQSPHVVQSPSAPRVVQGMPPVHNAQPAHYAQPAQYAHPAQYTSAVPVSRPYAVAAQPISPQMPYGAPYGQAVSPAAAILQRIEQNFGSADKRTAVRTQMQPVFDRNARNGYLDFQGLRNFFREAGQQFMGISMEQDIHNMDEFDRFDFDGNGKICFNEAYRCFKYNCYQKRKELGGDPVSEVPFKTPEQAGYTVVKILASGGQGSTALARGPDGDIAIKIYDKSNANAGDIDALRGESDAMKQLHHHPGIMNCIEIFQDQGHMYCVNELMPGGDLASLRKHAAEHKVALTEEYFMTMFRQCIDAIAYMHKNAIMHCDIKEPNIMLKDTNYGSPVCALIDLGMVTKAAGQELAGGTPGYMPPETMTTNVWFPRGDVFSMGVVFFQLMADKTPDEKTQKMGVFTEGARSMADVVQFVTTRQPPFQLISQAYPGAMSFLPSMLDKRRKGRPTAPQLLQNPVFGAGDIGTAIGGVGAGSGVGKQKEGSPKKNKDKKKGCCA